MYVSFRGICLHTLFYFSHSSNLSTFLCSYSPFFSFLLRLERTGIYSDSFLILDPVLYRMPVCLYMRLTAKNVSMYRNLENVSEL